MRIDNTLKFNFKFFVSINLLAIICIVYHIISNDYHTFLINHHHRLFPGIDTIIMNKIFYDVTIIMFYASILLDSFFTYHTFKEFNELTQRKKHRDRIYARKILFVLTIACLTTSFWGLVFFDNYFPLFSLFLSTITLPIIAWKVWLTKKANLGYIFIISVPIIISSIMNWVLTIEAFYTYNA